jgi:hypothetical protein
MSTQRAILIASDAGISIRSFEDITGVMEACFAAAGLILTESDFSAEFFDLKSGLAGELFQKFTIYAVRVAIVLSTPEVYGESFKELAWEHRTHHTSHHPLFRLRDEADTWLGR